MNFRVTIATGESPHQPNNTVNCPGSFDTAELFG